jgi:FlgD Ig-like domain
VAIADTKGKNVWAVTDKGNTDFFQRILYRNTDGSWVERSQSLQNFIVVVRIAPADPYGNRPRDAYALLGPGSSSGPSDGNRVFYTDDAGVNWQNLTGNLPAELPIFDLVENPTDADILYLATAAGTMRTADRGNTWVRWNVGWPSSAIVTRLIPNYPAQGRGFLYATTYGRGLWRRDISGDMTISTAAPPERDTRVAFRAQNNPAVGEAEFEYVLAGAAPVTLEIFDLRGRRVRRIESSGESGINNASWSGRDDAGEAVAGGVYFAVMRTSLQTARTRFVLVR